MQLDLQALLIAAGEAPPNQRINYRDPIARHGAVAVRQLESWLRDPMLAAFAVRTIARAGEFDARAEAVTVLRRALVDTESPIRDDIADALRRLGSPPRSTASSRTALPDRPVGNPSDLVVGRLYRRADLHDQGLGGSRQSGASYPARGTYVLLFSDPGSRATYGYKDSWDGTDRYRFFGKWEGLGDMTMTGANAAIRDRSPELHLFTRFSDGYRYQGRFEVERVERERTEREDRQFEAIVFVLRRASVMGRDD